VGNSAILAGLLLGLTFSKQGFKKMDLGSILTVGEMPFYYYTDADGDQVACRAPSGCSTSGWLST